MSGPSEPSDGRAVKANQAPSGEYAADWPTTLTPEMIARLADTVGSGVRTGVASGVGSTEGSTEGSTDGSTEAGGVTSGVALGSIEADSDGSELAAADSEATGVSIGSGVRLGVAVATGVGDETGIEVGCGVGRDITTTESLPAASVPTTTAWFLTGDCEMDFGRIERATCFESRSLTGSQSGWRSVGQTLS